MFGKKSSQREVREGLGVHFPRLWRYCLVLSGRKDLADDLAQAACVRALEKASLYKAGTRLDSWLFRIAQRLWLNEMRAGAIRRGQGLLPIEDVELTDNLADPETNIFAREVLSEVLSLPEAQRTTVLLVYVEGFSYREAAEMLDIPIGTVMSRLAASRARLAGKFSQKKSSKE